jgi:hypothetical protein
MGRRTSSSRLVRGHRGFKSVDKSVTARYGTNTTLFLSELRTLSCRVASFRERERSREVPGKSVFCGTNSLVSGKSGFNDDATANNSFATTTSNGKWVCRQ